MKNIRPKIPQKPKKTAALYDPYLDILGGGEKHILSILKILEEEGYEVSVFWEKNLSKNIEQILNLRFNNLHFIRNIFADAGPLQKIQKLREFDILLYVTDGSYFISSAKTTIIFCMVPDRHLYRMSFVNKLKTIGSFFIANSIFTKTALRSFGIRADVIYPYIDNQLFEEYHLKKQPVILSVGRFFKHLHAKRHDVLIQAFKKFNKTYPDYRLILAGGAKKEDEPYIQELKSQIGNDPRIEIRTNIDFQELLGLYRTSSLFWHITGYGIDEKIHPEMVEHLGMTPLESMAAKTPALCYNAGGPKELIDDGRNGILFLSIDELIAKSNYLLSDSSLYQKIQHNAYQFAMEKFSYDAFKKQVVSKLL